MNAKAKTIAAIAVTGVLATTAIVGLQSSETKLAQVSTPFSEEEREFFNFVAKHRKNYFNKEEFDYRFQIFKKNYNFVKESNADSSLTYKLEVNHLSDLTPKEFADNYLGLLPNDQEETKEEAMLAEEVKLDAPASVDWTKAGKVQSVKNQGQCGSCWAFATVAALESCWAINHNSLPSLSEQELVDCASSTGNQGCNGGWPDWAYKWVESNGKSGLEYETEYRYTARTGSCHATTGHVQNSNYNMIQNSESALKNALAKGPVAVAVQADASVFQQYKSGVITGSACGSRVNHAVTCTGYGTENGVGFYLIKNSWGASWGDNGYVRVGTEKSGWFGKGVCGIYTRNSQPTC